MAGYGGLVDRNGVLWSATYNGPVLRFDTASGQASCVGGVNGYGLGIGPRRSGLGRRALRRSGLEHLA